MSEQIEDVRKGWTSASNASADRLCAGRHQAQKTLPDLKGEWAEHGTAIHAALADSGNPALMEAMTTEQRDMFESHREVEKELIKRIWPEPNPDHGTRVFRHQRFWCKVPCEITVPEDRSGPGSTREYKATIHYPHSGEADFVMLRNGTALIQDYKSLAGDVSDSPENEQLRDLAIMVWRTYQPKIIYVAINQPMVTRTPKLCLYTPAELEKAEQEMWDRVRKSNHHEAIRVAGEIQCQWCKAKQVCKEYAIWSSRELPAVQDSPFLVAMQAWSPEQRSRVAEHLPRLKKLLDDAGDFLKALLEKDPESVPGFYLKPGAIRHPITDAQELFNRFLALDGSMEQFMKCVTISKGTFEEQVRAVTKEKGKGLKLKMDQLLQGITDNKPVAPSLARKEE